MKGSSFTDVAVIGAGPYGLSMGAQLAGRGVRHRIFGRPMEAWRNAMPRGMYLKSTGCASNLSDPAGKRTLEAFCAIDGEPYDPWDTPIPIDQFARYGEWFQRELVPELEQKDVVSCTRDSDGFLLELEDGETLGARSVVVSNGLRHSARLPDQLANLPKSLVTHSSAHRCLDSLRDQSVIVIGAGQSALESAALLKEAGASATVVARRDRLAWNPSPEKQTSWSRVRHPRTHLGLGYRYVFYSHPLLPFYYLPEEMRIRHVKTVLGPAGAWWLRERFVDRVPVMLGCDIQAVRAQPGEVVLEVGRGGEVAELRAQHVIAATGYRVSPDSFPFLSRDLREAVRWEHGSPALSRNFESTVPGLHFVGLAAANRFGPVMRFVAGVHPTAPRLARFLASRFKP